MSTGEDDPAVNDLTELRERFPGWVFEARWITAGTASDRRHLLGHKGGVTVSGWAAEDLAAAIELGAGRMPE